MRPVAFLIAMNLTSAICALGAVIAICFRVDEGWGWLLFMAALTHTTAKFNQREVTP